MVDRSFIESQIKSLEGQRDQLSANLNAIGGALKAFEIILAEFDKGEEFSPPDFSPEV